jgi:hypothetical protein
MEEKNQMIIRCHSAELSTSRHNNVALDIYNLDAIETNSQSEVSEIVSAVGEDAILDEIGKDRVMEYFGLVEEAD